jgi:HD superfamily phosphohydrolase
MEQSLAALFHDVTTPVFAHVVDFLNGDHLTQESTEAGVAECLSASPEVCALLEKYSVNLDAVSDYHCYPIADNDSPALSADRLEYTMGNLLNYGFASLEEIQDMYDDLMVGVDESDCLELMFRSREMAAKFTSLALKNSRIYVADEDRFAMESLADLLRRAMEQRVVCRKDLMRTEPEIIALLKKDAETAREWERFCRYSVLLRAEEKPDSGYWVSVNAKKRWIDPLAKGLGRVSVWHEYAAQEIAKFCAMDFSHWLSAE